MSADSVRKLLNLPDHVRQPHAYQIFGLPEGEQDAGQIQSAVDSTIQRLREVRSQTDPNVWNQAAQLAQQARVVLADPQKKAELDARFGIVTIADDDVFDDFGDDDFDASASSTKEAATPDPLAGLLPNANPLSPAEPAMPVTMNDPSVESLSVDSIKPVIAAPTLKTAPASLRRRKSSLPMLLFSVVAMGLTFCIVGLTYYLVLGPGSLAIQTGDGSLKISAGQPQTDGGVQVTRPRPPASTPAKRIERDPVMGRLGRSKDNDPSLASSIQNDLDDSMTTTSDGSNFEMPESVPANGAEPEMTAMPAPTEMPMPTDSAPDEMQVKAADDMIAQTQDAIRSAEWSTMKSLAEKALDAAKTQEQRSSAQGLYQLADLATYYRGGIERAIQGLAIGNTFDVAEGFSVIIVETGVDKLTIRYDAKSRSFSLNELPLVLAHKLASFQVMPGEATADAAKAAYQSITPVATPPYREQAIQWLQAIDAEIEGADRDQLIAAIQSVFKDEASQNE